MPEQNGNNSLSEDFEVISRADDEFVPKGAWPVCPNCFQSCNPLHNYCENCGSNEAINPIAPYLPFVNIRFNYGGFVAMWRGIRRRDVPRLRKWVYMFMIIIFAPVVLVIGLPFFLTAKVKAPLLKNILIAMLYIIAIVLLAFLLPVKIKIEPFY